MTSLAPIPGIGAFTPRDRRDRDEWRRLADFIASTPRAFHRDHAAGGHVTGGAFLLSPDGRRVLLTHHAKLGRWLHLGGHCDGLADAAATGLREAQEESGIAGIRLMSHQVYDLDIHPIPANPRDPAHLHYDVRYLMQADGLEFTVTSESNALAWVRLDQLERYSDSASLLRMRDRLSGFSYPPLR